MIGRVSTEELRWYSTPAGFEDYCRRCLVITSKDPVARRVEKRPLKLKRAQRVMWESIRQDLEANAPVRKVIDKARKIGASTLLQAINHWLGTLHPNNLSFTVSFDFPTAMNLSKMQWVFYQNSPIKPKKRTWNRTEIHLDNPDVEGPAGLNSRFFFLTCVNENAGRSYTPTFFHGTEAAYWEKVTDVFALEAALMNAMYDDPWTFQFLESSPDGEGWFADKYMASAEKDRIFISSVADENYRLESEKFSLSPIEESRYGDEVMEAAKIRKEVERWYPEWVASGAKEEIEHEVYCRLAWRRGKIDKGMKLDKFRMEFPISAEDSFRVSGGGVFDQVRLAGRAIEIRSEQEQNPPQRFAFDANMYAPADPSWWQAVLREDVYGELRVYQLPDKRKRYVIGADCSNDGEGKDKCAAEVLMVPEMIQVAVWNKRMLLHEYAILLYALGIGYNCALLGVEHNGSGKAVIDRLEHDLRYPNLYADRVIAGRSVYGIFVHPYNKPALIAAQQECIASGVIAYNSPDFIEQARAYRSWKRGRFTEFGAPSGYHDDMVTADYLAIFLAGHISDNQDEIDPNEGVAHPYSFARWIMEEEDRIKGVRHA